MTRYLEFMEQKSLDLTLRFAPNQEFRKVVDVVRSIKLPPIPINEELAAFSVLELLSNSIRAHQERGVGEDVELKYSVSGDNLVIEILDSGRGFDPGRLPYPLDREPDKIDPRSEAFVEYRLRYGNGRFGMGLLAARKTFPAFSLSFVDRERSPCPWFSGLVRGTRIVLSAPLAAEAGSGDNRETEEPYLEELPVAEEEA